MHADLHIHTTYSDGLLTPQEIIEAASRTGIGIISITDHDSLDGCAAAREYLRSTGRNVKIIAGIELGTQFHEASVHVLGYHIRSDYAPLNLRIAELRNLREKRLRDMIAKVHSLGYNVKVTPTEMLGRAYGRPHVAKALVDEGYFADTEKVFEVLLGEGKPAYMPQPKLSTAEAVALIHDAGGIACLAHPSEFGSLSIVNELLADFSFDGLEVWHPSASGEDVRRWLNLAGKHNLTVCGGSDFHGGQARYPRLFGEYFVLYDDVKSVIEYKYRQ